ncbi:ADP-ribosyl cyclase/cyclic ADP-ribose hydrolase 1-like [Cheilinus undulatus]|uniref:ADP-ribosyl cyclase/cyclic ADP-ribose hydrolase 1-like n=1 Tax=Cheilinus undulatus TaxID=241271 RepID=UPI001BD52FA9|nr:ADP-ribosyl cyclase/cyclic ADP-ribose hydrolase 1-like [Cheilinus undulatus]
MGSFKTWAIAGVVISTMVVVVVVVVTSVSSKKDFRETFMKRCLEFPENQTICENLWTTFEQAYVGIDKCNVSEENYGPFLAEISFKHPCGETMFWSKTYDLVHEFTEETGCLFTLEDTLLGHLVDGLSWCGKRGSKETFTQNCEDCEYYNPVSSFWRAASTRFAQHACEEASVMLDGERTEPYDSNSFFGGVEVPNLQPSKVKSLTVVLVSKEDRGNCTCESLGSLRKDLDSRIGCTCEAVTQSHVETCIKTGAPCGGCW